MNYLYSQVKNIETIFFFFFALKRNEERERFRCFKMNFVDTDLDGTVFDDDKK